MPASIVVLWLEWMDDRYVTACLGVPPVCLLLTKAGNTRTCTRTTHDARRTQNTILPPPLSRTHQHPTHTHTHTHNTHTPTYPTGNRTLEASLWATSPTTVGTVSTA